MYPVSVDNKARYCAAHGCTLVVGGPVPEAVGRSARWLKVAWLRRCFWRCAPNTPGPEASSLHLIEQRCFGCSRLTGLWQPGVDDAANVPAVGQAIA